MVEAVAPGAYLSVSPYDAPGISLRQMPSARMTNVRGRGDKDFAAICGAVIGLPLPVVPNHFVGSKERRCLWQGPDEWLIIDTNDKGDDLSRRLDEALAGFHHAVTDVSGNRTTLRLSGDGSIELLSAGCSLDCGADSMGPGMAVQTILARTPVTIMCIDDAPTFDLLVRRSLAPYVQAWLVNAAGSVLGSTTGTQVPPSPRCMNAPC